MLKHILVFALLSLSLSASAQSMAQSNTLDITQNFAPDQDVLVQKSDGNWYTGWVIRAEADRVLVAFNWSANEMAWVSLDKLRENTSSPIPQAKKWVKGWNSKEGTLWDLAVSADGRWLAAAAAVGYLQIFEQASLYPHQRLNGRKRPYSALAFSPDSQTLAACDDGGQVSLYTTHNWQLSKQFQLPGTCEKLAFSQQGILALAGYSTPKSYSHGVWLYNAKTDKRSEIQLAKPSSERLISALQFDPSGKNLALGYSNQLKGVELFQLQALTLKSMRKIASGGDISSLTFSPEGKYLAGGGTEQKVSLWNWRTGQRLWSVPWRTGKEQYITSLDFSPNGQTLAVCGMGSGAPVQLLRTGNGQKQASLGDIGSMNCNGVRFSRDGQSLYTIRQVFSDFFELILERYRL
jgi:WD40 repeat protein